MNMEIKKLTEEIYQNVVKFVEENKGNDDKYYGKAYLTLPGGREMTFRFNQAKVDFYTSEDDYENEDIWEHFSADKNGKVDVVLNIRDRYIVVDVDDDFEIRVYYYNQIAVSKEDTDKMIEWLTELKKSTEHLSYNAEKTHSFNNLYTELIAQYNISKIEDYANKNNGELLPSITKTIDWWCNELVKPFERRKTYEEEFEGYVLTPEELEEELKGLPKYEHVKEEMTPEQLLMIKQILTKKVLQSLKDGEKEVLINDGYGTINMYEILKSVGNDARAILYLFSHVSANYAVVCKDGKLITIYGKEEAPIDYKEILGIQEERVEEISRQK